MIFSGKHIWIIGASEGIGAALALRLAEQGARLTLSARNEEKLKQLLARFPDSGHRAIPIDVTDEKSVARAWAALNESSPPLDMVIYNAGTYEPMDAEHFNLAQVEHMLDVNFRGALRALAYVLPDFIVRNTGRIALVGSVAGYRGLPASIGYGASKAAMIHLAENLKADLAKTNIRVQIINPGFVETRLTAKNDFAMPAMISPEKAAAYIMDGLASSRFEIHFPKRFSLILKFLSLLPSPLYFQLLRRIKM